MSDPLRTFYFEIDEKPAVPPCRSLSGLGEAEHLARGIGAAEAARRGAPCAVDVRNANRMRVLTVTVWPINAKAAPPAG
jgi:hypothetical protein